MGRNAFAFTKDFNRLMEGKYMIKCKYSLFILLLSVLLIGCGNTNISNKSIYTKDPHNKSVSEAANLSKLHSSKSSVKNETYVFYDRAVQNEVELYFDKTASELNENDYKVLSELDYFIIEKPLKTLKDIPNLFPNIKYLNFNSKIILLKEEFDILKKLHKLKALSIHARPTDDLEFAKHLAYFEISYNEKDCYTEKNNLASFSVLGKDFINKNIKGTPIKYMRVRDEIDIYELVLTDEIEVGEFYSTQARTLFVSNKNSGSIECTNILDDSYMIGDFPSNKIFLEDVNFDGKKDILIDDGHFGNQQFVRFTCFLNSSEGYQDCISFSDIYNPSIDKQNKKILSSWRNWAASHSWAMYVYDGTEYVMTNCLTEELIIEETNSKEEVWQYTIEKLVNDEVQETEEFTTKDYTTEELHEKLYSENSYWALSADKWNTLFNFGKMSDFSIYGNGNINYMILDIISE